jgi:hypothetical protein
MAWEFSVSTVMPAASLRPATAVHTIRSNKHCKLSCELAARNSAVFSYTLQWYFALCKLQSLNVSWNEPVRVCSVQMTALVTTNHHAMMEAHEHQCHAPRYVLNVSLAD